MQRESYAFAKHSNCTVTGKETIDRPIQPFNRHQTTNATVTTHTKQFQPVTYSQTQDITSHVCGR